MDWFNAEEVLDNVTVEQLEQLCELIRAQREKAEEAKKAYSDENTKLEQLEMRLINVLKDLGKDSYKSNVGTFSVSYRTSVRVPQGDDKFKFFEWLKERGLYDGIVSVNSQTLNSLYRSEFDRAKEEGRLDEFKIPGIGDPTINPILSFRKAKQ